MVDGIAVDWRHEILVGPGRPLLAVVGGLRPGPVTRRGAGASVCAGAAEAVATVGGTAITRADLDALVAPQIAKLDEQAHQIRRAQLDELIAVKLLEAEAKARNLSFEALEKTEVLDKVDAGHAGRPRRVCRGQPRAAARRPGRADAADPAVPHRTAPGRTARGVSRRAARQDEGRGPAEAAGRVPRGHRPGGHAVARQRHAKVTVVEFSDFHCPFCRRVQPTLTQLLAKYPTAVKLVYKHMPLDQLHPQARRAAEASWCAQQQGKFWQYHDLLYAGGPDGSDATLSAVAGRAGLDPAVYQECMASGKAAEVVQQQVDEGAKFGVSGTPGFFVNGRFLNGAVPLETFVQVIDEELER